MIYQKRGMWKSSYSSIKFVSEAQAEAWEIDNGFKQVKTVEENQDWTPLEKLRGWKGCNECGCDPCECEEEWNSVEETSSETESSMEETF